MKKLALALTLIALPFAALAGSQDKTETTQPKVTITAKGNDVNTILGTIFEQAKKQYVIAPNIHFALFFSLDGADLDKALKIVADQASLQIEFKEGIYYVTKAIKKVPVVVVPKPAPKTLSNDVLTHKVTTRFPKTDLRTVFAEISKQTSVTIEIAAEVPSYKVDAFLIKTSLKFALDELTKATKLDYRFTDHGTIQIFAPVEPNHVAMVQG